MITSVLDRGIQETKPAVSSPEPASSLLDCCEVCGILFEDVHQSGNMRDLNQSTKCSGCAEREEKGLEKETEEVSFSEAADKTV